MKYQSKNKIIFTFIILQTIKYITSNIEPIKVKPFEKIYFNNSNEILIEFNNQIPDNYTSDLPPDILINIELNEYIDLTVDISTAKTLEILFSNETDPLTKNIYHGYSKYNQYYLRNGSSVNNGSHIYYFYINGTIQNGSFEISNVAQKKFINVNEPYHFYIEQSGKNISVDKILFGIYPLEKDIILLYEVQNCVKNIFSIYKGINISQDPYYINNSDVCYDYVKLEKGNEYTIVYNIDINNQKFILNFFNKVIHSLNPNENFNFRSKGKSDIYSLINIKDLSNFVLYADCITYHTKVYGKYIDESDIDIIEKHIFEYEYIELTTFEKGPLIFNKENNTNYLILKIKFSYSDNIINFYNVGSLKIYDSIPFNLKVPYNELSYIKFSLEYHSEKAESYLIYCDQEDSLFYFNNEYLSQKNFIEISPSKNETYYLLLLKSQRDKFVYVEKKDNTDNIKVIEEIFYDEFFSFSFEVYDCSKINFISFIAQRQYSSFNTLNLGDAKVYRLNNTNGNSLKDLLTGKNMKIMDKVYENFGWKNEYFVIKCNIPSIINFDFVFPTIQPLKIDISSFSYILFLKENEVKYLVYDGNYQIRLVNFNENNSLSIFNNQTGNETILNKDNIYINIKNVSDDILYKDYFGNYINKKNITTLKSTKGDCLIYINQKLKNDYEIIEKAEEPLNLTNDIFIKLDKNNSKDIRIRLHTYETNIKYFEYIITYGYIPYIDLISEYKSKKTTKYNKNVIIDFKNPFIKDKHELLKDEDLFIYIPNDKEINLKIDFIEISEEIIVEDKQYLFEKTDNNISRFSINLNDAKTFAYQINQCDSPRFYFKLIGDNPGPIIRLSNEISTGFYQVLIYKNVNYYTFEFSTDRNYLFRYKTYKETLDYVFNPNKDYKINITKEIIDDKNNNFVNITYKPYLKKELVHYFIMIALTDDYIKNISDAYFFFEMINKYNNNNNYYYHYNNKNALIDFLLFQFDNISYDGKPINISLNTTIVPKNKNYSLNIMAQQINNYHFIEFYEKKSFCYKCDNDENNDSNNVIIIVIFITSFIVIVGILGTVFYIKKKNGSYDGLNDMEKMID